MGLKSRSRTVAAVLLLCCTCGWLQGCAVWNTVFHRSHDNRCTEKPFQGNTANLAGLRVPEGLTPPEQRNQVKIPALNEPERTRSRNEPCLTQPPSYASGSSITLPTRSGLPVGAPAPAPAPALPTQPALPAEPSLPEPAVPQEPVPPLQPLPPAGAGLPPLQGTP